MMRDKDFGMVRVTAFGIYSIRVKDPGIFVKDLVGTDDRFTTGRDRRRTCAARSALRIKEVMPELGIPVIEMEAKVCEMGTSCATACSRTSRRSAWSWSRCRCRTSGLPEEVEKAIDKRGAIAAIGNLQAYTQYETASSIHDAANNPGGAAGAGMGLGAGIAMGAQMANSMSGRHGRRRRAGRVPPPIPGAALVPRRASARRRPDPSTWRALQQQVAARAAHARYARVEERHGAVDQGR